MTEARSGPEHADLAAELEAFHRLRASGDPRLRGELVERHRPLAISLARRFADRGEPLDDLVQVAQLALVKAVDRFDPERGLAFATFAVPTVLGELKRHFRDRTWAVRVGRKAQELHAAIRSATGELSQQLGRSPTVPELARHLNVSEDSILEALEAGSAYRTSPLIGAEDSESGRGGVDPARLGSDDSDLSRAEDRATVEALLALLPERERRIVELRFFQDLTQAEIAQQMGMSQMHVSRLLRQSFAVLRSRLDH